jgi:predicted transcriptional regulator
MMQPTLKRAATAFVLASIVLVSFVALLQKQKNLQAATTDPYCLLALPTSFSVTVSANSQASLNNGTRAQIYNYIENNPGVQFRGICAALSLPVGLAQYHLGVLVKAGLVSFIRDGRYKRFFLSKKFSRREMLTISLLRHKTARRILEALLNKKQLSHGELAGEASITSQALTWQMKRLGKTAFVLEANEGLRTIYSLDEASAPLLKKYLTLVEESP